MFAALLGCFLWGPETVQPLQAEGRKVVQCKDFKEGSEVTLKGKVLGREKRPEGVADSNLALRVSTADYGEINVVYSTFRLCHNEVGASVREGDRIEVHGKAIGKHRITVCLSRKYYIKKL